MSLWLLLSSFWVTPPLIEIPVTPGSTGDTVLWLYGTHNAERVQISCLPMAQDTLTGDLYGASNSIIPSALPFLKISTPSLDLDSARWVALRLSYRIPDTAAAGGRYAVLEIVRLLSRPGQAVQAEYAVEVPIWLVIQGPDLEPAWVEVTSSKWTVRGDSGVLRIALRTQGRVHTWVRGNLRLSFDGDSSLVNPFARFWMFPGAQRILTKRVPTHKLQWLEIELFDPHGLIYRRRFEGHVSPSVIQKHRKNNKY